MSLRRLIESINRVVANTDFNNVNDHERKELLQACERLQSAYETPLDVVTRLYYSVCMLDSNIRYTHVDNMQSPQAIVLRVGVDLKLFDAMAKLSNEITNREVSVQQLADETGAEPLLLGMQLSTSDKATY